MHYNAAVSLISLGAALRASLVQYYQCPRFYPWSVCYMYIELYILLGCGLCLQWA